jgi:hypothetical protein
MNHCVITLENLVQKVPLTLFLYLYTIINTHSTIFRYSKIPYKIYLGCDRSFLTQARFLYLVIYNILLNSNHTCYQ